jgi:hypothetical protein
MPRPIHILLLCLLAPRLAGADEGESAFSVGGYYSTLSVPDHSPLGGALELDYEYGVTDVLWLRASAGGGLYFESDDDAGKPRHRAQMARASVGISYALDVLRYVPYVNLGLGAAHVSGTDLDEDADPPQEGFHPLVQIGGGLNILSSPEFSWGLQFRFENFLGKTALFLVGARASFRWGFF